MRIPFRSSIHVNYFSAPTQSVWSERHSEKSRPAEPIFALPDRRIRPLVGQWNLGAVVLGAYTNGELRHYGYAGSGFSEKGLKDAVEKMKPLFTEKCPFVNPPNIKEKIQWIRPKLVCEVESAELTAAFAIRPTNFTHAVFRLIVSASLFFCSDFSGDELQGNENQAASSFGPANDYAAVPVPGVPCLCLTLSHGGTSTTDDFGLHF